MHLSHAASKKLCKKLDNLYQKTLVTVILGYLRDWQISQANHKLLFLGDPGFPEH